jgi:hypothetical protein
LRGYQTGSYRSGRGPRAPTSTYRAATTAARVPAATAERDDHGPGPGDHEDEDAGEGGEPRSTEEEVLDAEELATAVLPGQVHVHGRVPGETGRHDTSQNPPADVRGL